jgi:hypothetical protein
MSRFDVDEIRSRMKKSSASNAAGSGSAGGGGGGRTATDYELWDEFKVAGFSRTLSSLYVCSMLHALIKVQLSVVSRYVLFDQQAQQQRQEAEQAARERGELPPVPPGGQAAAAAAGGASPSGSSAAAAGGSAVPPPLFLPPPICEEVNRLYFSLSRHGQGVGAAQLADHVAALVAQELAPWKALAGQVARTELQASLRRIHERVQREALGLECKTDVEAHTASGSSSGADGGAAAINDAGSAMESGASAAGASASTTVFTSTEPYVRFLLPNSAGLSSLVSSTNFPDPAINNMASFRLAEMVAETNALVNSGAFRCTLVASFDACLEELFALLEPSFQPRAAAANNNASGSTTTTTTATTTIPFASALVALIKLFNTFLPDVPTSGPAASAGTSVASPLFALLSDLPAVKELCAVIYLPADVITAPPAHATAAAHGGQHHHHQQQQTTLQSITSNKTFAGNAATTSPAAAPAPPRASPLLIEEEKASTAAPTTTNNASSTAGAGAGAGPLSRALQDVRGLPVFDRM